MSGYEIELSRQQIQNGTLNGMNSIGNAQGLGYPGCYQQQLQPCFCYHCGPSREPTDFELTIVQVSEGEPLLNYGLKLRLLIADPIKGMHLREAIHQLKTALKEAYGKPA